MSIEPEAGGPPELAPSASAYSATALVEQYRGFLLRARASKFARDSASLLVLNLLSRAVSLFASAYAVRSLGPVNVGISAIVQTMSLQVALTYNGGFDTIAVRRIAADRAQLGHITRTVVAFRGSLALLAALLWIVVTLWWPGLTHRGVWLLGSLLVLLPAANLTFVFNGAERLPIQNVIATGGTLLAALAYVLFFRPGMQMGADLVVAAVVGIATTLFSWTAYHRSFEHWPIGRTTAQELRVLIGESWRYWLLAIATFLYSTFQISIVGYFLGSRDTGLFRSAFVMAAAVELFFNSINTLLLPRLVAWNALGLEVLWRRQRKLLALFCGIGIPPTMLLIVLAPHIYRVFLGVDFLPAVGVFQILVFGRLIVFLGQIYAFGLAATGLDDAFLAASLLGGIASVVLSAFVIPHAGLIGAANVTLVSEVLVVTFCYLAQRRHVASRRRGARDI